MINGCDCMSKHPMNPHMDFGPRAEVTTNTEHRGPGVRIIRTAVSVTRDPSAPFGEPALLTLGQAAAIVRAYLETERKAN